ncbi:MFS transporter [Gymnodinialimonas hymeniacidonis]|uniref:MFS transporter n=1 Tax=Gymnodinialimonas hymeniacidonis TaxID=3126508 RepID=UPI0034C61531
MTLRVRITAALGVVQILTWGSSFYLLAVLAAPIVAETGWPMELVTGGVSIALLVSGVAAPHVARFIRARGGRRVMSVGVIVLALGLLCLSMAPGVPVYLLAWALIGCGMSATLYDAAFSTLGTIFGDSARGAITQLTLWGGFASTVCWPLSAWMVEAFGWRGACLGYVALHLCVTLPLCLWGLPRGAPGAVAHAKGRLKADVRHRLLAFIAVCLTFVFATISVHLITLLTATGLSLAAAVGLGALIGPAQVGARLLEMLGRERHAPIVTQFVATSLILSGVLALWFDAPAGAALIAYGAGNGLYSIARGTVPLARFGAQDYPLVMAYVARPAMFAAASGPVASAWLIGRIGPEATLLALAGLAALALCATGMFQLRACYNP